MKISWNEQACCHSGNCVRSLPEVFSVQDGRFVIRPDNAPQARVGEVIAGCPGRALRRVDDE